LASVVVLIVLTALLGASAQKSGTPKYDRSTEVKVKGVVDEVKGPAADGTIHITLKTDKEALDVSVAPEKFMKEMEITLAKGDSLEITGSKVVTAEGSSVLLAREIGRNGDTMMMRDEKGAPVWVGWPK
jgi:hypothetical protein